MRQALFEFLGTVLLAVAGNVFLGNAKHHGSYLRPDAGTRSHSTRFVPEYNTKSGRYRGRSRRSFQGRFWQPGGVQEYVVKAFLITVWLILTTPRNPGKAFWKSAKPAAPRRTSAILPDSTQKKRALSSPRA
jgi:hypothetical protein